MSAMIPTILTYFPPYLLYHTRTLFVSFFLCNAIRTWSSSGSPSFFPQYARMNPKQQKDWDCHVVSMVYSCVIVPFALALWILDPIGRDNIFGYNRWVGELHAVSCGFLWDAITSASVSGPQSVVYGIACFLVFFNSFSPFLMPYGPSFLLWEASTPFLNLNWFFELTPGLKDTNLHLINGLALFASFFLARIVFGTWMSLDFFRTIALHKERVSPGLQGVYMCSNVTLNLLNYFWFYKMLMKVRRTLKRVGGPKPAAVGAAGAASAPKAQAAAGKKRR